ncbi:TIGR03089 family protein [Micromonospora echinofusca]|uniref:AMP-dependent synthetase n=1 Tax=Micromonospora echinofusca TaxID=47858 RepID=A0ABS3VST8_MICEH|nr:TIGR03089 family protein [Micromonospora echinofusca]MBO4207454.1 AMP-dependent synthetase [Micromonospora echinofusca]
MNESAVVGVPGNAGGGFTEAERPLLTYYDDATGERTELTATGLGQWAARSAGLLRQGCGLGVGSRAAVLLPPHWQTAAVLLGAWSAGVAVSYRLTATAGLAALEPGADEPFDATFVTPQRLDDWLEDVPAARHRFVLGLAPAAAPLAEVPAGYRDWLTEVRQHPADLPAYALVRPSDPATPDGTSYQQWGSLAEEIAAQRDLRAGDRVLVDAAAHEHPVKWLLAPLAVGASVVLCANLDPGAVDSRIVAEQVTRVF